MSKYIFEDVNKKLNKKHKRISVQLIYDLFGEVSELYMFEHRLNEKNTFLCSEKTVANSKVEYYDLIETLNKFDK
jgi:hypothetical protein